MIMQIKDATYAFVALGDDADDGSCRSLGDARGEEAVGLGGGAHKTNYVRLIGVDGQGAAKTGGLCVLSGGIEDGLAVENGLGLLVAEGLAAECLDEGGFSGLTAADENELSHVRVTGQTAKPSLFSA